MSLALTASPPNSAEVASQPTVGRSRPPPILRERCQLSDCTGRPVKQRSTAAGRAETRRRYGKRPFCALKIPHMCLQSSNAGAVYAAGCGVDLQLQPGPVRYLPARSCSRSPAPVVSRVGPTTASVRPLDCGGTLGLYSGQRKINTVASILGYKCRKQ